MCQLLLHHFCEHQQGLDCSLKRGSAGEGEAAPSARQRGAAFGGAGVTLGARVVCMVVRK